MCANTTSQMMTTSSPSSEDHRAAAAKFSSAINIYVDGVLCLAGYVGNLLTVLVLSRQKRTSNSTLLQGLAVVDSCFLTYVLLYVVMRSAGAFDDVVNAYIVAFVLPFGWTAQTAGIWMVVVIAADRYIVVWKPLRATQYCTAHNARRAVVAVATAAVLFNVVRWPRYYLVAFYSQQNTTFVSHLDAAIANWDERLYRLLYHISLTLFFLFLLPLSCVIALNARLVYHVKRALRQRRELCASNNGGGGGGAEENSLNLTKMLVIMIAVFAVCQLPDFVASIIGAGQLQIPPAIYEYYAAIKEAMLVLNAAINFYLYCLFYRRFRHSLAVMFGCQAAAHGKAKTYSVSDSPAGSLASSTTQITTISGGGEFNPTNKDDITHL